ncbi:acyl-CoA dehydrogenase family protein [Mycolicibacterium sp. XJ1819]
MNLEVDDIQRELIAVTADVCNEHARRWQTSSSDHSESVRALADIGVIGVRHPEPHGSGLSAVEAVLAAIVCGAALAPTPLMVWADLLGQASPEALQGSATVSGTFDQTRGVSYGGRTDKCVIVGDEGAVLIDTATSSWEALPHVDPTTPRAMMGDSSSTTTGVRVADVEEVDRWRWQFAALVSAHLVGVGIGALQTSVTFANERRQFGRPIGSFQAIKHLLADTYTSLEMARSQVLTAALCWAENYRAAPDQAFAAAVVATPAAIQAGQTAIQVHGGMGFTAEATPHLYYKRALQLQEELQAAGVGAESLLHRDLSLHG